MVWESRKRVGVQGCLVIQDEVEVHGVDSLEKRKEEQLAYQVWDRDERRGEQRGVQGGSKGGNEDLTGGMKVGEEWMMVVQLGSGQLELGEERGPRVALQEMRDGFGLLELGELLEMTVALQEMRDGFGLLELGEPLEMTVALQEMRDGFGLLELGEPLEQRMLLRRREREEEICQQWLGGGKEHWLVLPWRRCGCGDGPSVPR